MSRFRAGWLRGRNHRARALGITALVVRVRAHVAARGRPFLGLAGYYRRFIPEFSKVAQPMTKLLQKDVKFVWRPTCEEAFQALKHFLTTVPVLA